MKKYHWISVVIFLCLALSILGAEWTTGFTGGGFFWLRAASRIGPPLCLFVLGAFTGAFRIRSGARRDFALLGGLLVLACLVTHEITYFGGVEWEGGFDYSLLGSLLAVACGYQGYWVAQNEHESRWLLRKIAFACALGSLLGGCLRVAGLEGYPFLVPGWPTRLVFLFGYCWYLHQWLTSRAKHLWGLLGVAACSVEVWLAFHKPVVFSASVASVVLVCYSLWATRRPAIILWRMGILSLLAITAFVAVNTYSSGRLLSQVEEIIYEKFLHQSAEDIRASGERLEKAAGGRFDLWEVGFERFKRYPLFGSGFGQSVSGTASAEDGAAVYLHNWYLDYLVSGGIVGSLPIFAALVWWLLRVSKRRVITQAGSVVVPCLAYIAALMAYNLGGSIRMFFSVTPMAVLIMAMVTRVADQALTPQPGRPNGQPLSPALARGRGKPSQAGRPSPRALVQRQATGGGGGKHA